jgi:TIR domain
MSSQEMKPLEVFLAHSSGDKEYVRAIHHLLALDGFHPWLDEFNLIAGQNWELEIEKAVERATAIIVFLSQRAISSAGYLHKEIAIALDAARRQPEGSIAIIPIRLDSGQPPRSLQRLQWIDVSRVDRLMPHSKIAYLVSQHSVEGFMVGESYIRLRRALQHLCQQVGGIEIPEDVFHFPELWGRIPEFPSERYLVHGRSPDGNSYFGTARITSHEERLEMIAQIGSERHTYTGEVTGSEIYFTGPHEFVYLQSGNSRLLVGEWDSGGLEELIPAAEIPLRMPNLPHAP